MNPNTNVDKINAVIRGVSVITGNVVARGHDLEVDSTTLEQMRRCAEAKGQVPVKVDHKSGAAAVCGYLCNFSISENQLKADWYLLKSHPSADQILETAERMPRGVGLSASFVSPEKPERTAKGMNAARCQELISVDYVAAPAANPNGLFARVDGKLVEFSARRAQDTAGIHSVIDATRNVARKSLPGVAPFVPFHDQAKFVGDQLQRHPSFKKKAAYAAGRALVGAAGAGLLARKLTKNGHARVGAVAAGALAGAFLDSKTPMTMLETINAGVDIHAPEIRVGARETHDLQSLSQRVALSPEICRSLIDKGALGPVQALHRNEPDGLKIFSSDHLNRLRSLSFQLVAEKAAGQVIEAGRKPNSGEGRLWVMAALNAHSRDFAYRDEDEPGIGERIAKGAAVVGGGAALLTGSAYLRGRASLRKPGSLP